MTRHRLPALVVFLAALSSYAGVCVEEEAFFVRSTAKPFLDSAAFTVGSPEGRFEVRIENGPEGYGRVSSAQVWLNGVEIFSQKDFNQKVEGLSAEVEVAGENALVAKLNSKPGSALAITVVRVDDTPPAIQITSPENGSVTNVNKPEIRVEYTDSECGIDLASLQVLVNGEDRTALFDITPGSAVWTVPAGMELPEGANTVHAEIADRSGNVASTEISFVVDITPPEVVITWPGEGAILNETPIEVQYTVDGEPRSRVVELQGGENIIVVEETDEAGNRGADTVVVTLQSLSITIVQPTEGSIVPTDQPEIRVEYVAAEEDLERLQVLIDGEDMTSFFTVSPTYAVMEDWVAGEVITATLSPSDVFMDSLTPTHKIRISVAPTNELVLTSYGIQGSYVNFCLPDCGGTCRTSTDSRLFAGTAGDFDRAAQPTPWTMCVQLWVRLPWPPVTIKLAEFPLTVLQWDNPGPGATIVYRRPDPFGGVVEKRLTEGPHTVVAKICDASQSCASSTVHFEVDIPGPAVTVTSSQGAASVDDTPVDITPSVVSLGGAPGVAGLSAPAPSAPELYAVPCPARQGETVTFVASTTSWTQGSLTVFDHTGNVVFETGCDPDLATSGADLSTVCSWDLTGPQGLAVPSGTYLAVLRLRDADGSRTALKTKLGVR
jgi:hypothetical protein